MCVRRWYFTTLWASVSMEMSKVLTCKVEDFHPLISCPFEIHRTSLQVIHGSASVIIVCDYKRMLFTDRFRSTGDSDDEWGMRLFYDGSYLPLRRSGEIDSTELQNEWSAFILFSSLVSRTPSPARTCPAEWGSREKGVLQKEGSSRSRFTMIWSIVSGIIGDNRE